MYTYVRHICVCVYVCMYVYIHAYFIYICTHSYRKPPPVGHVLNPPYIHECMQIILHTYMHTCIQRCDVLPTHTYIHTHTFTCIRAYMKAKSRVPPTHTYPYTYTYMYTCPHIHTCKEPRVSHTYIHTYIHTESHHTFHAYIHTYIHTYIQRAAVRPTHTTSPRTLSSARTHPLIKRNCCARDLRSSCAPATSIGVYA